MELHPDVVPLAGLLGTWTGSGRGHYPTIDDFVYEESASFETAGMPWIAYSHRTRIDGQPRHAESGFLRVIGPGKLELVTAMPTGHVEFGRGGWREDPDGLTITVESLVETTPSAKEVTATRRVWRLRGDQLEASLAMAAVGLPLQDHLAATLDRRASSS